ncbi:hypothetical protein L1987_43492 [Smallanthus sonchifolius]|uniref:Uncharacterized protein n=1 Tax=Smallanthus sonchifolius TaxID=185202 RepID=A0ACB9GMJ5_9ASTR|nr:hypothetical protein L1987_43492 [Smallanthus sonchifolius]
MLMSTRLTMIFLLVMAHMETGRQSLSSLGYNYGIDITNALTSNHAFASCPQQPHFTMTKESPVACMLDDCGHALMVDIDASAFSPQVLDIVENYKGGE